MKYLQTSLSLGKLWSYLMGFQFWEEGRSYSWPPPSFSRVFIPSLKEGPLLRMFQDWSEACFFIVSFATFVKFKQNTRERNNFSGKLQKTDLDPEWMRKPRWMAFKPKEVTLPLGYFPFCMIQFILSMAGSIFWVTAIPSCKQSSLPFHLILVTRDWNEACFIFVLKLCVC